MKARIERDWGRDAVKVWLYQTGAHMTVQVIAIQEDGELLMCNYEEGTEPPAPSFILPTAALEALVKEAAGVLPPSETTVDAMRDARETRDRLLTLVERTFSPLHGTQGKDQR